MAVAIVVAAALLIGVCYLPLVLKRDLPQWLVVVAVAIAVALASGVIFAIITGHWPFSG
jgi:hypothetical protein